MILSPSPKIMDYFDPFLHDQPTISKNFVAARTPSQVFCEQPKFRWTTNITPNQNIKNSITFKCTLSMSKAQWILVIPLCCNGL